MAILSAMQSAAMRLIGRKPSAFFSSAVKFEQEIADLVNEVATDICKTHDWQGLTKIHTMIGDGSNTAFSKPDDYDRMVLASSMGGDWFLGYEPCPSIDRWIAEMNQEPALSGWWILLGDLFQFSPAPSADRKIIFPYISKNYAIGQDGSAKREFNDDRDTFELPERLLTLGLIWRWRETKHLDTTGDQAAFEKAFSEESARDHGARVIREHSPRFGNVSIAYPYELG